MTNVIPETEELNLVMFLFHNQHSNSTFLITTISTTLQKPRTKADNISLCIKLDQTRRVLSKSKKQHEAF